MANHVHQMEVKRNRKLKAVDGEITVRIRVSDLGVVSAEYVGKDKASVKVFAKRFDDAKYTMCTVVIDGELT